MLKIGFAGIPGTGKTTQARALSEAMASTGNYTKIELVKEYARDYISKHGSIEEIWEEYRIFDKQLDWEETIIKTGADVLITDSPLPLIFLYASLFHTPHAKSNMVLQDIFKSELKANTPTRYDIIFYLPDVLQLYNTDIVRESEYMTKEWRSTQEANMIGLFNIFEPKKFIILKSVSIKDRNEECMEIISKL